MNDVLSEGNLLRLLLNILILEEKETKQIFLLYVDGKRRMKIDENKEVTALD